MTQVILFLIQSVSCQQCRFVEAELPSTSKAELAILVEQWMTLRRSLSEVYVHIPDPPSSKIELIVPDQEMPGAT